MPAAPEPAFALADAIVVVFESAPSTFTMVILLFGLAVAVTVLSGALRTAVLV